jgi:thiamine-phosphate pyrophosphorylase
VSTVAERLAAASLYLVCGAITEESLEAALRGGVQIVQLRAKDAEEAELLRAAEMFARACRRHNALFIVNDHPELAVAAGADGVHVGQDDAPVAAARAIVGAQRIVGLSTHTPAQIDAAGALAVDYIGVGPVNITPTKPGRPAVGTELVQYAATHARMPFFAIGGIDAGNLDAVLAAGGTRVAVVRAIADAEHPERAARELAASLARHDDSIGATRGATA